MKLIAMSSLLIDLPPFSSLRGVFPGRAEPWDFFQTLMDNRHTQKVLMNYQEVDTPWNCLPGPEENMN